ASLRGRDGLHLHDPGRLCLRLDQGRARPVPARARAAARSGGETPVMSVHEPESMKPAGPPMRGGGLSAASRAEIDALRPRYPTNEAVLLPALHIAQKQWGGWLPDEAIAAVAAELDLPVAKVYGVVTFYDLFHQSPVGRHR